MLEKSYSLKFTPKASEDLEQIYIYISEKLFTETAAESLLEKIESSILRLRDFPYSCSYVLGETLKARGYRKLAVENYIVFYIVNDKDEQIIVMRILYGAQNYQDLL